MNACLEVDEHKDRMLRKLCTMGDSYWSSNGMIILSKFGKLPTNKSLESNQILAGLTCDFITKRDLLIFIKGFFD